LCIPVVFVFVCVIALDEVIVRFLTDAVTLVISSVIAIVSQSVLVDVLVIIADGVVIVFIISIFFLGSFESDANVFDDRIDDDDDC